MQSMQIFDHFLCFSNSDIVKVTYFDSFGEHGVLLENSVLCYTQVLVKLLQKYSIL